MISTSYHAIALRFRQLYACVRWNDMAPDEDDDVCFNHFVVCYYKL